MKNFYFLLMSLIIFYFPVKVLSQVCNFIDSNYVIKPYTVLKGTVAMTGIDTNLFPNRELGGASDRMIFWVYGNVGD